MHSGGWTEGGLTHTWELTLKVGSGQGLPVLQEVPEQHELPEEPQAQCVDAARATRRMARIIFFIL